MSLLSVCEALVAAGASADMLLAVIRQDDIEKQHKRDKDAARKRKSRAGMSRGHRVTSADPPREEKVSPDPFQETQTPPTPSPPKGGSVPIRQADFERFWDAYPRKVGKGAARAKFATACGKIGGPDPPGVLMAALEAVKPTWADPKFIPHPATWLGQERWSDQPVAPPLIGLIEQDQARRKQDQWRQDVAAHLAKLRAERDQQNPARAEPADPQDQALHGSF